MRADRLISTIMLLQTRGRMTAQALAEELEVSPRTVYRDIEALSAAGIPVYAESGPGGGCALLGDYRSDLTGLTGDEVRALLMLGIPGPLMAVGASQALRSAMLKLLAALPAARRGEEARVRQRIHLDWAGWGAQPEEPVPHLRTIQQAVWQDHALQLTISAMFDARIETMVHPYGLVGKAGIWYLVCAREGETRVIRVSRVLEARITGESFRRPEVFDLARTWEAWRAQEEEVRAGYPVTVRLSPELVSLLPLYYSQSAHELLAQAGAPDREGWIILTLAFEGFAAARERILGWGRAVEVLAPEALRRSVVDYAEQIVAFYGR